MTPTDEQRAAVQARWAERPTIGCDSCDFTKYVTCPAASTGGLRELHRCLVCVGSPPAWRAWFDGDEYLAEVSARVGPDDPPANAGATRCDCGQCRPHEGTGKASASPAIERTESGRDEQGSE